MRKVYFNDRKEHVIEEAIKELRSDPYGYVEAGMIDDRFLLDSMIQYLKKNYHPLQLSIKENLKKLDLIVDLYSDTQKEYAYCAFGDFVEDDTAFLAFVEHYRAYCHNHMANLNDAAWDIAMEEMEQDGYLKSNEKTEYTVIEMSYDKKYTLWGNQAKIQFPAHFVNFVDTFDVISDVIIEAPDTKEPILLVRFFNKQFPMGYSYVFIRTDQLKNMLDKHPELKEMYKNNMEWMEKQKNADNER